MSFSLLSKPKKYTVICIDLQNLFRLPDWNRSGQKQGVQKSTAEDLAIGVKDLCLI